MSDIMQLLGTLRRPRLLISAARHGGEAYNRNRDLKRVLNANAAPSPASAVDSLIAKEAVLEETRQSGDVSYSVTRHVDVLIALMAEARLLPTGPRAV